MKDENKLKIFGVSVILSLCLFLALKYGPGLLDDPILGYCEKARECVSLHIDADACKERIEMLIKYGRVLEDDFSKCAECVNSKSCWELVEEGQCDDLCDNPREH